VAREPIARRFGNAVRKRPTAAELSQEALADAARVHPTYVSLLERGLRDPKLSSIAKIARALGVSASVLVGEAERPR
jgi:transcriptional regulator with XRE-family HTH domain